jgi:hypothetical protein
MKNFYSKILLLAIVIIAFLSASQVNAQSATFTISSVGEFPGMPSVSSPSQFISTNTCLDVQTGVAVLEGERGTGVFAINCEIPSNINTLGVNIFPNPASSVVKVKFEHTPPLTENFNVTVIRADGVILMTTKESGYSIFQGISIDVSRFPSAGYILKIESAKYVDVAKFIKS